MKAVNLLAIVLVVVIPRSMKAQSPSVTEIDELKEGTDEGTAEAARETAS